MHSAVTNQRNGGFALGAAAVRNLPGSSAAFVPQFVGFFFLLQSPKYNCKQICVFENLNRELSETTKKTLIIALVIDCQP